jgi:hypothetical protein
MSTEIEAGPRARRGLGFEVRGELQDLVRCNAATALCTRRSVKEKILRRSASCSIAALERELAAEGWRVRRATQRSQI